MKALTGLLRRAGAAAASLTGKRFGLLVASSVVATSAIVAAGMTSSTGLGPLAALAGQSLATPSSPVASAPEAADPAAAPEAAGGSPQPASGGGTAASVPSPSPAPLAPEATPSEEPEEEAEPTPEAPAPEAGQIKHVFVISLAGSGYDASFGSAPQMAYLAGLRPQGLLLSNYSVLDDAALANSLATVSGQPPNAQTKADCPTYAEFPGGAAANSKGVVAGSGCVYPVETLTLADQLAGGRFSWRAYMEGMADEAGAPDNCVHPQPETAEVPIAGGYSTRLNPFVYFHSLLDLGDCATNDVPLTGLEKDLKKIDSTANYSYISPDLCNAGFAGQCPAGAPDGALAADAYLAQLVPKILASAAYKKDGLLMIVFGAVNPPPIDPATGLPGPAPAEPLKTGALLLSQFISPGSTDAVAYDPYSMLRSTEDLFGLSHLAKADGSKVKSFAPALLGANGGD